MENRPHKYDKNQRVRLLGAPSNLYPLAAVGSEGWIRNLNHDNFGYPIVFIEWDKDHWTYNGEHDEWTLEDHFEAIEKETMRNHDPRERANDILEQLLSEASAAEPAKESKGRNMIRAFMESVQWPPRDKLAETLSKAALQAADDESFLLITIHKDEEGNLIPTMASCFCTPESAILLEAQLTRLAAIAHADVAGHMINAIMDERDKNE